ncbi:MAG: AraC family transcriptional regulator [Rhizobiaceae bacterium]
MNIATHSLERPTGSDNATSANPAVLAAAATGMVEFIEKMGGDVDRIFGHAGISPDMAGEPTLKLSLSSFCLLFEEASRLSQHDNFGLWFGNQFSPQKLGLWGYATISSSTVGMALENLVGLFRYQQESSVMSLSEDKNGLMRLEYQIQAVDIVERRQDAELSLGMFFNVIREGCGASWVPEEVHFEHAKPENWKDHETAFSAPVYFSQPKNALLFKPDIMKLTMPGRDLSLMTIMQTCLKTVGDENAQPVSLIGRIQNTIRTQLPDGYPSLEQVALTLKLSPSVIQRELAFEGLTYKGLIETTRNALALMYIRQRHLPFSEIAFLLGYSELSAFSRAVRRWTGFSPRKYRAQLANS